MPAIRFGTGDLLEYNPKHSLLICRECQYAIQKNALESHLLRHKIYRGDRQRLLSSIAQLDLLEPDHVPLPTPSSPPVDDLPILSGYCCTATGCRHLTVSPKRMKRHWSESHASVSLPSSFAHPVKLQTFFRGTKVRYFEVASPTAPPVNIDDDGDGYNDDGEENEAEGRNAITGTPPAPPPPSLLPPRVPASPEPAHSPSPADFNLETLTYFHHFTTVVSLTLPGFEDLQSTKQYWQMHVVSQALQRRWLMCGLLAISAHYLATFADDTVTKRVHCKREAQLSSEFFTGLEQTTGYDNVSFEVTQIDEKAKKISEQVRCLLLCAQLALIEPAVDYESMTPSQLPLIISTIRGCVIPDSTLLQSDIQNDGRELQEEQFAAGLLQTRNSSHGEKSRTNSFSDNIPSVLLNRLHSLPHRISEGLGRPDDVQDAFASLSAITMVVECCDISFASNKVGTAWHGVAMWLVKLTDHFNQMLLRHHPAALVVLAHWAAVLVKRAERVGCWFLKGFAKIIVVEVARHLSVNGRAVLDLVEDLMTIVNS